MNKLFTKIATAFVGIAMAIGVGVAVASKNVVKTANAGNGTITLVPNNENTGNSSTSYVTSHFGFDYEDVHWSFNQWNPKTLQIKTNQTNATNEFNFYTGVFPGNVTEVVITFSALTVATDTGFKLAHKATAYTSAQSSGGDTMTWNATNKTLTWSNSSSTDKAIAFYQNGKVATGTNYITQIDVTYSVSTTPTISLSSSSLFVGVGLSSTFTVTTENLTANFSIAGATSAFTLNYTASSSNGDHVVTVTGVSATSTVTLTVSSTGATSRTINITVKDVTSVDTARYAMDNSGDVTNVFVKGIVSSIIEAYNSSYHNITFDLSDDGTTTADQLRVYRCSSSSDPDVMVGDVVVAFGNLTIYKETYEFSSGCTIASLNKISSLNVSNAPTTISYSSGDAFDASGLEVTATYEDTSEGTHVFTFADHEANFTLSPDNGDTLNSSNESVAVTYGHGSTTQTITVTTAPAVISVAVNPTSQTLFVGSEFTITATVNTEGGASQDVSWSIQNSSTLVSIKSSTTSSAVIKANSSTPGTATVIATSTDDGTKTASCTITILKNILEDGDTFVIKANYSSTDYYLTGVTSNLGTTSTNRANAMVFTAIEGETSGQFQLKNGDNYLSYEGTSNNLYFTTDSTANSTLWTAINNGTNIVVESVNVSGRKLQFNYNSGNSRFACYTSAQTSVSIEMAVAPEVDEITLAGDTTADAAGLVSVTKEFLYEVTYVDVLNPGTGAVEVSVLNSSSTTTGASVTSGPLNGSFEVTFTVSDTFTVTVTSSEDSTKTASITVTVTNIYVASLTDYALYEGTTVSGNPVLTEGDYLITYDDCALNTTIDGSRAQYDEVTPSADVVSTDETDIVWHIAPAGDYYTIYNATQNKYLASTGAKNKAQLLADGTDDKSLWSVTISEGTFEFTNKQNTTNGVNAALRKNGTYGFACYDANSTGGTLTLYKKAYNAVEYSRIVLNYLDAVCDATNGNTNVTNLTNTWKILSAEYTLLDSSVQSDLTPSSESQVVKDAISAYDYVVGKYNKAQGVSAINDYLSRNPAPVGSVAKVVLRDSGTTTTIIVVISMLSLISVSGFFFLRRRKEQ